LCSPIGLHATTLYCKVRLSSFFWLFDPQTRKLETQDLYATKKMRLKGKSTRPSGRTGNWDRQAARASCSKSWRSTSDSSRAREGRIAVLRYQSIKPVCEWSTW